MPLSRVQDEDEDVPSHNGDGEPARGLRSANRRWGSADSHRWFGYVAVGITLVSMAVGLALAGWGAYRLFHWLMPQR